MADLDGLKAAFAAITESPEYLSNLDWGAPRVGHPEGSIRNHILELEDNLSVISEDLSVGDYWRLKIMIHVHDTFKPETVPGGKTHGELAAEFLTKYLPDENDMIQMVANHDALFFIWRRAQSAGSYDDDAVVALHGKIQDWNLFVTFMLLDSLTAGKDPRPLDWMIDVLQDKHYISARIRPLMNKIDEELGQRAHCL